MASSEGGGQERASKKTGDGDEVEVAAETTSDVQDRVAELTSDVDDLLDEIDDVLEQNAEEFVRSYVQKGGQ